jgi:hypothetical protein
MDFSKVFDIARLGLQVTLTVPKEMVLFAIWADESVEFDSADMQREFMLQILPAIEAGQRSGQTRLFKVHWREYSLECGEIREEGIGNPVFSWKVSEPWWSPNNEKWWETPFCGQSQAA